MCFLRGWRSIVAQHDVEGSGKVVGKGTAVAFIHERQQESQEQQSQEQKPQKKSEATRPLQQPRSLQQQQHTVCHTACTRKYGSVCFQVSGLQCNDVTRQRDDSRRVQTYCGLFQKTWATIVFGIGLTYYSIAVTCLCLSGYTPT